MCNLDKKYCNMYDQLIYYNYIKICFATYYSAFLYIYSHF